MSIRKAIQNAVTAGCGGLALALASIAPAAQAGEPSAGCGSVVSYPPPGATDGPFGITQGPGGTWYAEGDRIVQVKENGRTEQFQLPDPQTADAGWLTWGGGNTIWFADRRNNRLGTISVQGGVEEWTIPSGTGTAIGPGGIVVTDGVVWFTDPGNNRIGRFDPATTTFAFYDLPTSGAFPLGITLGPDKALWFTERLAAKVGRMTVDGEFSEWNLSPGSFPNRIITGPDGAIWFTELGTSAIGHITMDGALTQAPVDGGPVGIMVGPDQQVYVALFTSHQVARLGSALTPTAIWTVPGALLITSSHGSLWVTDTFADSVSRLRVTCDRDGSPGQS